MARKILISFITVLLLSPSKLILAQETQQPAINVKTNPFASMLSMIPLSAEVFVLPNVSASANVFIVNSKNGESETYFDQNGFGISPEFRYYFTENNINGHKNRVYAGLLYNYEEGTNTTLDRLDMPIPGWSHAMGGALLIGNQWFFKNHFTFDVFLGPAYMNYVKNKDFDTNLSKGGFFLSMLGPKASGTRIKFGFNIGIAF